MLYLDCVAGGQEGQAKARRVCASVPAAARRRGAKHRRLDDASDAQGACEDGNIEFLTDLRRNSNRGFTLVSAAHSKYSQSVTCCLRNTANVHFFFMTVCSGWGLCVHAWHVRRACTLPTTLDPHTASEAKLAKWNDGLKLAHRGVRSQPRIACKCMPDRKCLTHVQHMSQIPGHLAH